MLDSELAQDLKRVKKEMKTKRAAKLHSEPQVSTTTVTFRNNTQSNVNVCWVDADGKKHNLQLLRVSKRFDYETYADQVS